MELRREIARRLDPKPYAESEHLRETVGALSGQVEHLQESVATHLQIAREDRDWILQGHQHDTITWQVIRDVVKHARMYYLLNPIIKRAINLRRFYVFGRGIEMRVQDKDGTTSETASRKLAEIIEQNRLLQPQGMSDCDKDLQTDGNLFLCCSTDTLSGQVRVRQIDPLQIQDIVTAPGDAEQHLYYLREWSETDETGKQVPRKAYYPAMGNEDRAASFRGIEVRLDEPVAHEPEERPFCGMLFGMPSCYAAMQPASEYRGFLAAWVTLQQALKRFALKAETKGGERAVSTLTSRLNTTITQDGGADSNPPPIAGSVFVSGPGTKLDAMKTAGATDPPEEARILFLFAIMSLNFPEHMYGDPSTGNLATAKTLDRPTELMILATQARYKALYTKIVRYAITKQQTSSGGELRSETDLQVLVSFPPVLEHDIKEMADAIVSAATLNGNSFAGTFDPKTVLLMLAQAFGMKDLEQLAGQIFGQDYDPADWAPETPEERAANAQAMAQPANAIPSKEARNVILEAIAQLRESLKQAA